MTANNKSTADFSPLPDSGADPCLAACENMLVKIMPRWSIQEILDFGANQANNPLILYTTDGKQVFFSNNFTKMNVGRPPLIRDMRNPDDFLQKFSSICEKKATDVKGVYLDIYQDSNSSALSIKINTSAVKAVLALVLRDNSYTPENAELMRLLALGIEKRSLGMLNSADIDSLKFDYDEHAEANMGAAWIRRVGGDRIQNFFIAVIETDCEDTVSAIKSVLREKLRFFRTVYNNGHLVVLINCEENRRIDTVYELLNGICAQHGILIGLSENFFSVEQIHAQYSNALMALKYGNMAGFEAQVCDFKEDKIDIMILNSLEHIDPDMYLIDSVEGLRLSDSDTGAELYNTLLCYLSSGGAKKLTCDKLNIHRNTLAYRLDKISSISGIDLSDGMALLNLWFSIKIAKNMQIYTKTHKRSE